MAIQQTTTIPEVKDTIVILRELSADEQLRRLAEMREKRLHDEASNLNGARCIYRSVCHSCTEYLPHLAADCSRALPGKKRVRLTSTQTGSWET